MNSWRITSLTAATLVALAACTNSGGGGILSADPETAAPQVPAEQVVLLDGPDASALSVQASAATWATSPVAVVVDPVDEASVTAAAEQAKTLAVPVFAVPAVGAGESGTASAPAASGSAVASSAPAGQASASDSASGSASASASASGAAAGTAPAAAGTPEALQAELQRLGVDTVLAIGTIPQGVLGDVKVVTAASELPEYKKGAALADTTVLTAPKATTKAADVALASLAAAGAGDLALANRDPRQRAADVEAMAEVPDNHFVAVGAGFGPLERLETRVGSAVTGVQLPGGGQTVFYDKRYVAIYGHPLTGALGVLGEQDPQASVARVKKIAKPYQKFTDDQVIPAFEIIATVAAGTAGKDGNYSNEWSPKVLKPHIDAAKKNGIYVLLDLQSGMSDFLSQAKLYEDLLKDPQVGLALDPEWKLKPGQKPLAQFGSVDAKEINATTKWLAKLVRENNLPQKMFLLHQFRLDMITNRDKIDMTHDELAYTAQMDGTGSYGAKLSTWNAVTKDSPEGLHWGWKNFYDEDQPTMTPQETYENVSPKPWWVSYQ